MQKLACLHRIHMIYVASAIYGIFGRESDNICVTFEMSLLKRAAYQRRTDTSMNFHRRFSFFFYKGDNFLFCFSWHHVPSEESSNPEEERKKNLQYIFDSYCKWNLFFSKVYMRSLCCFCNWAIKLCGKELYPEKINLPWYWDSKLYENSTKYADCLC